METAKTYPVMTASYCVTAPCVLRVRDSSNDAMSSRDYI